LGKSVILSDIPVHREQINKNVHFFDPLNELQLAEILFNYKPQSEYYDYSKNKIEFAQTLYSILNEFVRQSG
jgi:hypothetical protein